MNRERKEHFPLPLFLNGQGRKCVVIGGGAVALRKTEDLVDAGAEVTVVAEIPDLRLEGLSSQGKITLVRRRFIADDMKGAFLAFVATDNEEDNKMIHAIARGNGVLVNVVDNPDYCDFYSGAVVKRGPFQIAVSTSGCSPALAARIRGQLEGLYGESYNEFVRAVGEMRQFILTHAPITDKKKKEALEWLAQDATYILFSNEGHEKVWQKLKDIISS